MESVSELSIFNFEASSPSKIYPRLFFTIHLYFYGSDSIHSWKDIFNVEASSSSKIYPRLFFIFTGLIRSVPRGKKTLERGYLCVPIMGTIFHEMGHKRKMYMYQSSIYLRVPSKRVAIVSRKVFCGARRPFLTGIGATPPRCHALESAK